MESKFAYRLRSKFFDYEPLTDGKWHRIRIPLDHIAPDGMYVLGMNLTHLWPGQQPPITVYLDDVRLIG
jgi:hypothetical protein